MLRECLIMASGLGILLAAGNAQAMDEKESAEFQRLGLSLRAYVQKQAWGPADRAFEDMEAISAADLSDDDLFFGAEAARGIGDMGECQERLLVAFDIALREGVTRSWDDRARAWLGEVQLGYGRVSIKAKGTGQLSRKEVPFRADRRLAIQYAGSRLDRDGVFEGLLPAGHYQWGRSSFTVSVGEGVQKVKLKGSK